MALEVAAGGVQSARPALAGTWAGLSVAVPAFGLVHLVGTKAQGLAISGRPRPSDCPNSCLRGSMASDCIAISTQRANGKSNRRPLCEPHAFPLLKDLHFFTRFHMTLAFRRFAAAP